MCSPSQGPCCTTECILKYGDKCRDDNGCRDPSYCDGRMPQCPASVNKANKTICNKEFVCYMGVSRFKFQIKDLLINYCHSRNVRAPFAWRTGWNRVNASLGPTTPRPSRANCAARFPARAINAKAPLSGIKHRTTYPICSPSLAHRVTITTVIATFSKSVAKLILRDH